jgi:hypothetical protein
VAGRASVWSDERLTAAAKRFVTAADENWRLQRGDDSECLHFQAMADQGHYGGGGGTRQGIYVAAPSGRLLASVNSLDADAVLATLERGLAAWETLPDPERWLPPGADIAPAHRWEQSYPEGGLVLTRIVRDLPADGDAAAEPRRPSNRDHAWFSADEARAFLPAASDASDASDGPAARLVGATHALPAPLALRLARLHLVDNVRGQTLPFAPDEVREADVRVEILAREGDLLRLRITGRTRAAADGPWLLGENDWTPPGEYPRGVSATLYGDATYDTAREAFTAFTLVGVGTRWGSGWLNGRRADDAGPIGWLFTLAPDTPAERVAPAFVDLYAADWIVRPAGS